MFSINTRSAGGQGVARLGAARPDRLPEQLWSGTQLRPGREKTLKKNETLAIYKFTHSGAQSIDWLPEGTDIPHRDLYQTFIKGIKKAQADANISFIKTTHLPHRVVLFGTEGILALGEEMAKALGK